MSNDEILIHDGTTDTTVRLAVGDDCRVDVDYGDRDSQDAAKAVTGALRHDLSMEQGPIFRTRPTRHDLLRVHAEGDEGTPGRRLLTLHVADGRVVAEYMPSDLTEAAKQFVDAVMKQWIDEQDANRQFTADFLEGVLRDAARQQTMYGDTIGVELAARTIADLMWAGR